MNPNGHSTLNYLNLSRSPILNVFKTHNIDKLDELLIRCTVRIIGDNYGTGFFVGRDEKHGYILTCHHVIASEKSDQTTTPITVEWRNNNQTFECKISPENIELTEYEYPDLALIRIDMTLYKEFAEHPCVLLIDGRSRKSGVQGYGYRTDEKANPILDPFGGSIEGTEKTYLLDRKEEAIKIKISWTQLQRGMSGSAVLNEKTGCVCGILVESRDKDSALGGYAIPTEIILKSFPSLKKLNNACHLQWTEWEDLRNIVSYPRILVATFSPIAAVALVILFFIGNGSQPPPKIEDTVVVWPEARLLRVIEYEADLKVTALYFQDDTSTNNRDVLWIGATSEADTYGLYQLDPSEGDDATINLVEEFTNPIHKIASDCVGNLWLLQGASNNLAGRVIAYDPNTEQQSSFDADNILSKDTIYGVATACTDSESVTVWLGREGVQTLEFNQSDFPTVASVAASNLNLNATFDEIAPIGEVRGLHYAERDETLWIVTLNGEILHHTIGGASATEPIQLESESFFAVDEAPNGDIWVGGTNHLVKVSDNTHSSIALQVGEGEDVDDLSSRATVIAAGERWIWFGDICSGNDNETCWPLGVTAMEQFFHVDISDRREVFAIEIDSQDAVWIGTEDGLLWYPGEGIE